MYELNTAKKQKRTPEGVRFHVVMEVFSIKLNKLEWKRIGVFVDKNIPHEYDDFVVKL
jgi:hypothetical protein